MLELCSFNILGDIHKTVPIKKGNFLDVKLKSEKKCFFKANNKNVAKRLNLSESFRFKAFWNRHDKLDSKPLTELR